MLFARSDPFAAPACQTRAKPERVEVPHARVVWEGALEQSGPISRCPVDTAEKDRSRDTTVVGTQLFIVSPAVGGDAWRVGICLNINVS
jgi:hypothetical protein